MGPESVFRLPEIEVTSYRQSMTPSTEIRIAGVPWPAYKLIALAVGTLVLAVVGIVTMSAGPAVLSGGAAALTVWLGLGLFSSSDV